MPRKHPFHYDVFSKLFDRFDPIVKSDDPRLYPEVRQKLAETKHAVWEAWNLQCELERAAGLRR